MLSNTFSQASFLGSTSGDHNAGPTRQHPVLLEVSPISRSSSSSSRSNSSSGSGSGAKRKILPDLPTEPVSTHRIRFAIREFASLAHPRGSFVETGSHRLRGKNWRLRVYPRGHGQSRSDAVLVSWCLVIGDDNDNSDGDSDGNGNAPTVSYTNTGTNTGSNGDRDPSSSGNDDDDNDDDNDNDDDDNAAHDDDDDDDTFQFAFAVRDWAMVPSPWYELNDPTRGYRYGYGIMGHHRSRLLRTGLDADGTLVVDAELRFFSAKHRHGHGHRHKRPKQQVRSRFHVHVHNRGDDLGRQLWSNLSDTFDVAFVVEGRLFRAHSCVLAARAETLLELVEINEDEDEDEDQDITGTAARFSAPPIPIPIAGTDPDVFGALLEYAYTSDDAGARDFIDRATDPRATAWDLLVSADRWGCTSLKRLVESVLAEEEEEKEGEDGGGAGFLSPSNCCDVLLRADALSCPLLKKRALDMIASDPMAAMVQRVGGRGGGEPSPAAEHTTTTGWDRLRESPRLLSELFVHTANRSLSSSSREEREQEQKPSPDVESLGDRFSETGFGTDGIKQRMVRDWLEHEQWRSSTGR
eukprot:jgi/Psemu1/43058/gm1.43058_g